MKNRSKGKMKSPKNGEAPKALISEPWTKRSEEVLNHYLVDKEEGLSKPEVEQRRQHFGENELKEAKKRSGWSVLADQFKSLIVGLLTIAAIISFIFGKWLEGTAISIVLIINAGIGFTTEMRAVRSMEALRELTKINAKVRRNGEVREISADKLVPGDIVLLESGDIIPADLRIIEASKLQVDESALTGESVPVGKKTEILEGDIPLAERKNMLYKGTFVTRGSSRAVVISTGVDTELGKISSFIQEAEEEETPLEERLDALAQKLIPLLLVIALIVALGGIITGKEVFLMIETSITLAVATVPEGLPIVATLALARGMWRMADRNALVKRLSSVETLGSTSVICTDKTGTLTENRMTVSRYLLEDGEIEVSGTGLDVDGEFVRGERTIDLTDGGVLRRALEVRVLCNNASFQGGDEKKVVGDPMEVSLLVAGEKAGIDRDNLLEDMPEVKEISFDPTIKMMATFHEMDGGYKVAVKGAPEAVLDASSRILTGEGEKEIDEEVRERWMNKNERMAEDGLRVLALASKHVEDPDSDPYQDLTFLGLVSMIDPPERR